MTLNQFALLVALAAFAPPPLPELRVEPAAGGSVFYVRNSSSQPLTAYIIELVDYPGSSYSLWQDNLAEPIAPGAEKRIQVSNMMVGAVPEYVKLRAALYADGASAGIPEKVTQLVERRRSILETTRELIRRIERAQSKDTLIAGLREWANSLPLPAINRTAARDLIAGAIVRLQAQPPEDTLAVLRASERALAASKPAL